MSNESAHTSISQTLETANQTADQLEFSGILGSAVNSKWFETLLQNAGPYLFTAALVLNVIKLGFAIYNFVDKKNKNINANATLLWNAIQVGLIATAIIGFLVAATVFAAATPILFFTTMALDTLRNIALVGWNALQLAILRISVGKELGNPLAKLQYEDLKSKYLSFMKQHFIGAIISGIVATAVMLIFVFPHVGLGAISAASITVGSASISVAGIAGICAAVALVFPVALPVMKAISNKIGQGAKWCLNKLHSWVNSKFTSQQEYEKIPGEPQTSNDSTEVSSTTKSILILQQESSPPTSIINNKDEAVEAIDYQLPFRAYTLANSYRDLVIKNIDKDKKRLALKTLYTMINDKIQVLNEQIEKGKSRRFLAFTIENFQENTRNEKIEALQLIQSFLRGNQVHDKLDSKIQTIDGLIAYIRSRYPKVESSFFREESDTANILKALKAYGDKFDKYCHSDHLKESDKQEADCTLNLRLKRLNLA